MQKKKKMACSTDRDFLRDFLGDSSDYFAIGGLAVTIYLAYKILSAILRGLKAYFIGPAVGLTANVRKFGEWAVVTGATDGIGKAYAEQLARKGLSIVLISRSADKLADVAKEIENKYNVKTRVIVADFTEGAELYKRLTKELQGIEIGVLVNNVGMSQDHPQYFLELENKKILDMLNINCLAVTMMTNICLPGMVERHKGAIINVSSLSAMVPTPLLTLYSASKAFTDYFSRALNYEYSRKGIIIQSVMPHFVTTKLSKIRRASLLVPSPATYSRSALATLGIESRTNGYWLHATVGWVVEHLPEWMYDFYTVSMLSALRKRAMKRKAEKKE